MKNFNPEMIEKAKVAKTAEELYEIAKANGVEMSADEANTYFVQLNTKSGELDDDDLDSVAGGGCGKPKNGDLFPVGSKVRRISGPCSCGCNSWTVESDAFYFAGRGGTSTEPALNPRCDGCGAQAGKNHTTNRTMVDKWELI